MTVKELREILQHARDEDHVVIRVMTDKPTVGPVPTVGVKSAGKSGYHSSFPLVI